MLARGHAFARFLNLNCGEARPWATAAARSIDAGSASGSRPVSSNPTRSTVNCRLQVNALIDRVLVRLSPTSLKITDLSPYGWVEDPCITRKLHCTDPLEGRQGLAGSWSFIVLPKIGGSLKTLRGILFSMQGAPGGFGVRVQCYLSSETASTAPQSGGDPISNI